MPGEKGLSPEEVGRLVRSGMSPEQAAGEPEKWELFVQTRRELAKEGRLEAVEAPVLGKYVEEAKKIVESMVVDRMFDEYSLPVETRRVIATQLVVLYTFLTTDRLGQMYEREKGRMAAEGKPIPEPGSEAEMEKKISLAYGFVERIGKNLTGKDQLGIEVEYPNLIAILLREAVDWRWSEIEKEGEGEWAKYSTEELEMLQYLAKDGLVIALLSELGTFVTGDETLKTGEVRTVPGQWRQQVREIAAMVALGELKGARVGGRRTFNLHMTWPEVELSPENTEVMWIAPMLLAMGVDWPNKKKVMRAWEKGLMTKEKDKRFTYFEDGFYYFPYHAVRRSGEMENKKAGVETRSWLRVAIPEGEAGMVELVRLYRGAEWAEACRQLLVEGEKGDRQMVRTWEEMKSQFKQILSAEGLRVPEEGVGEMYREGEERRETVYEMMMHDLRIVRVTEPEKFERIRRATNKLRRETLKKMRGSKA